jgi:hypothetical protein
VRAEIVSVSDPYPDRGQSLLVWVYVEVRLGRDRIAGQPIEPARATSYRPDRELPAR